MITDKGEAEALKNSLLTNKVSPMSYSNVVRESLPEEVFNLDEEVEGLRINIKNVKVIPPEDLFID